MEKFGSEINIPDPQHWEKQTFEGCTAVEYYMLNQNMLSDTDLAMPAECVAPMAPPGRL